jgi:hypothetical protein
MTRNIEVRLISCTGHGSHVVPQADAINEPDLYVALLL